MPQNVWWTNQLIYNKICNIQTSPHKFDPARLLSIRLLHRLYGNMWDVIFPQKSTTIVCLGFFINPSSMDKLILYFNLQLMQKFKQGFLPSSFNQTWSDNRIRRGDQFEISLRNENLLNIPFARLSSTIKLPLVNLPRTWENFQNESIKIIRNKLEFNQKLKEHPLGELIKLFFVIVYFVLHVSSVPKNDNIQQNDHIHSCKNASSLLCYFGSSFLLLHFLSSNWVKHV